MTRLALLLASLCLSGCLGTVPVQPDRIRGTWAPGVEAYQVNRFLVVEQEGQVDLVCTWISDFYVCY
jgi:hypothetical protein